MKHLLSHKKPQTDFVERTVLMPYHLYHTKFTFPFTFPSFIHAIEKISGLSFQRPIHYFNHCRLHLHAWQVTSQQVPLGLLPFSLAADDQSFCGRFISSMSCSCQLDSHGTHSFSFLSSTCKTPERGSGQTSGDRTTPSATALFCKCLSLKRALGSAHERTFSAQWNTLATFKFKTEHSRRTFSILEWGSAQKLSMVNISLSHIQTSR